ncbi:hypothetical protein PsaNZ64_00440 [Pseudomonas syringae pv. actinidiae]|uniref:hypothetical protein n=1 Tax=Pseudomonas syringae group TaxID=136849 RepID=UPI0006B9786C|nr:MULTISPECIES: hypothetical protein [Pseudomonas syringae group]OKS78783.1 hypothetical protein PsaNZ64_00440 [Pseudomonas syringae pv. actinidiae]
MRQDYGVLGLGTREGNLRFTEEVTAWLTQIGQAAVEKGFAENPEVKTKHPPLASRSVGTFALYLVSASNADRGATLVVTHRDQRNPFRSGRADGVSIHVQARALKDGRWMSENFKTGAIPLISTDDFVVLDLLQRVLSQQANKPS